MSEIPSTKPTGVLNWATGGGAVRTEPGAPKRDIGWLFNEKPPYDFFNQIQGINGDYLTWLSQIAPRGFDRVYEGINATVPGEMFRTINVLPKLPGEPDVNHVLPGGDQAFLACSDGLRLYIADLANAEVRAYVADPESVLVEQWSAPNDVSPSRIRTDGALVAVCGVPSAGAELRIFDAASGAPFYSKASATAYADVAPDSDTIVSGGQRVFYVDGADIREWTGIAGDALWTTATATILAMCATPDHILTIENDASPAATGVRVVSYDKITKTPALVTSYPAHPKNSYAAICTDGDLAWLVLYYTGSAQSPTVAMLPTVGNVLNYQSGLPFWAASLVNAVSVTQQALGRIEVDDRYVYVMGADTEFYILEKYTGALIYRQDSGLSSFCIDGTWVYKTRSATPTALKVMGTTRQAGLWLRAGDGATTAADENFGSRRKPFKKLALPVR
jgi:hypothetical protein